MIRPYTVILAHRRLNSLPTAKDEAYLYRKEEVDLEGLTKEELGILYLEAQSVSARLLMEISEREQSTPTLSSYTTPSVSGAEVKGE